MKRLEELATKYDLPLSSDRASSSILTGGCGGAVGADENNLYPTYKSRVSDLQPREAGSAAGTMSSTAAGVIRSGFSAAATQQALQETADATAEQARQLEQ
ncbi:unnamed protein product, partial [Amoebophrya sp. A25]|eukprot:GSA25T00015188001.1